MDSVLIAEETFYGGSRELALDSNKVLLHTDKRCQIVAPDAGGRTLTLPDARLLKVGGPVFYLLNSSAHDFALKDGTGGALKTITAANTAVVALADNTTQAGVWLVRMEAAFWGV